MFPGIMIAEDESQLPEQIHTKDRVLHSSIFPGSSGSSGLLGVLNKFWKQAGDPADVNLGLWFGSARSATVPPGFELPHTLTSSVHPTGTLGMVPL